MANNENDSAIHIRGWPRDRCEDELASVRYAILTKVRRMCRDWEAIVELNKRKERIETRLEELGFRQDKK